MSRRRSDKAKKVEVPLTKLVLVEGRKLEQDYFSVATESSSAPFNWIVEPVGAGDPKSILKKLKESVGLVDHVYLVCDGDRRPPNCSENESKQWNTLDKYVNSLSSKITALKTFPSFEVWILLHSGQPLPVVQMAAEVDEDKSYSNLTESFKQETKKLFPNAYKKPSLLWDEMQPLLKDACTRSRGIPHTSQVKCNIHLLMRDLGHD